MRKSEHQSPGKGSDKNFSKRPSAKAYNKGKKEYVADRKNDAQPGDSKENSDKERKPFGAKRTYGDQKPKRSSGSSFGDRSKKSFSEPGKRFGDDDATGKKNSGAGDRKPFGERKSYGDSKPERSNSRFEDRPKKRFGEGDTTGRRDDKAGDRKPFGEKRSYGDARPQRSGAGKFSERQKKNFDGPRKRFGEDDSLKSEDVRSTDRKPFGEKKSHDDKKSYRSDSSFGDRAKKNFDKPGKRFGEDDKNSTGRKPYGDKKPYSDRKPKKPDANSFSERSKKLFDPEPWQKSGEEDITGKTGVNTPAQQPFRKDNRPTFSKDIDDGGENEKYAKPFAGKNRRKADIVPEEENEGRPDRRGSAKGKLDAPVEEMMPLNKYIAHSGECSRRDAAELVKQGKVKVNGELMLDPGYKVLPEDQVTMSGKKLMPQKGLVYILLNKPKGFITTNDDPQGRKTVMELVANSGVERIFPVGRLDRETSGLLLMSNDGMLTQKLSHPSYDIKKVYHVTLDKPLTKADFEKVITGVELEDGKAIVDEMAYLEKKNEIGLEIHSGRNRIVRRIFESMGYVVEKLDRVMYAGLTKKNLPRGKWRFLDEREIVLLKHFKS